MLSSFHKLRNILMMLSGAAILAAGLFSCQSPGPDGDSEWNDVHSFARPEEVVMTRLELDIAVDFTAKQIRGVALLHIDNRAGAEKLYLDSRDLAIERVTLDSDSQAVAFTLGEAEPFMGQPLVITIRPETRTVRIAYHTAPEAAALQWLAPAQTAGKQHPFLFTQSQPNLARTWVPCQDSPGIRFTYRATVKTEPALTAVMSARNVPGNNGTGVYTFTMDQPIPAYLMALAVGEIEYRPLGPRSGVFAEPSMLAKAAFEFADTERMIAAAEKLYGPYRWEQYDIIVLPPSFPFGGMENPRLTFATPTILAGDRSLVALIAHELAHSWSGNLVTNATWNDFWLNEGFTEYFEGRIMEAVYGAPYAEMLAQLGYQDMHDLVEELGARHRDTRLHLDLAGRDPDLGMTDIAYEKGRFFLVMLEQTFGRERWDAFLRGYFDQYAFRSMTSSHFLDYLREHLIGEDAALEKQLHLNEWVYGTGIPADCPVPLSPEFERVERQLEEWHAGKAAAELDTNHWTTHHWLHFLRNLPPKLPLERMADLDRQFRLSGSKNSEIRFAWLLHVIVNGYAPGEAGLEKFLTTIGRRKFLAPLYQALADTREGREKALAIYRKARPGYHPVTQGTIDAILGWKE